MDGLADVYALGALLHEALVGSLPSAGLSARVLRRHNPYVTPSLAELLAKCLAAEPTLRYATARALATDLRRYLAGLPLREVPNRSRNAGGGIWPCDFSWVLLLAVALTGGTLFLRPCQPAGRQGSISFAARTTFLVRRPVHGGTRQFSQRFGPDRTPSANRRSGSTASDNAALAERAGRPVSYIVRASESVPGAARATFPPSKCGLLKSCANKSGEIEN